ncbi:MAG: ribonuclease P protein component [Chitinophagales bacterium]|nr:ribonuclease P protein component [Chitinophagales bacterium]
MKHNASNPLRFTFKREERLSGKKLIDELFNNGSSFFLYPFKVHLFLKSAPAPGSVQVLMAVSSRNFPRSVDRNRLKRMMRECYRLNKNVLLEQINPEPKKLLLAFVYAAKVMEPYELINEKMNAIIHRLLQNNAGAEKHIK